MMLDDNRALRIMLGLTIGTLIMLGALSLLISTDGKKCRENGFAYSMKAFKEYYQVDDIDCSCQVNTAIGPRYYYFNDNGTVRQQSSSPILDVGDK
jgi:hypothetical protein